MFQEQRLLGLSSQQWTRKRRGVLRAFCARSSEFLARVRHAVMPKTVQPRLQGCTCQDGQNVCTCVCVFSFGRVRKFETAVDAAAPPPTAGRYFIAGIVLNLPACKSITSRRERMF